MKFNVTYTARLGEVLQVYITENVSETFHIKCKLDCLKFCSTACMHSNYFVKYSNDLIIAIDRLLTPELRLNSKQCLKYICI